MYNCFNYINNSYLELNKDNWKGKWFPAPPDSLDKNPVISEDEKSKLNNESEPSSAELHDDKHGIKMGVSTSYCDDAKVYLYDVVFLINNIFDCILFYFPEQSYY